MAKSVLNHAGEPFDAATATFLVIRGFLPCYLRNKSFCGERTGAVNIVNCCITS